MEKLREITPDNWIKEGHGFTADSYRSRDDENLLLKLFYTSNGMEIAEQEYARAINVAALGIPTPKTFEMVMVEGKPGILFERIVNKHSFGRLVTDNPEKLPEYAGIFAEASKALHGTKCDTTKFPDQKEVMRELVRSVDIREEIKEFLFDLLDRTDDIDTCLHGDLQTGNIVMGWCKGCEGREREEGEAEKTYFIDLGTFAYGDPVFDIAEMYVSTKIYQNEKINQEILHMTAEQLDDFWKYYAPAYIGSDDPVRLQEFEDYVAPYSVFFMMQIISAADGYEPSIRVARAHIDEVFEKYRAK